MHTNPFQAPIAAKEKDRQVALGRTQGLLDQLAWYRTFQVKACRLQLERFDRVLAASKPLRDELGAQIAQLRRERAPIDELAQLRLDPRSWFSSERRIAKRQSIALAIRISDLSRQLSALNSPKTDDGVDIVPTAARLRADLETYLKFDEAAVRGELATRQQELGVLEAELADLRARKLALDGELVAPCQALEACRAKVGELERSIRRAEALDDSMTRSDGAGRRLIHERCEREFHDSSPRRILHHLRRQLDPLMRDIAKHEKRIEEAIRHAQLDVREVIIDGSNMAYHGGEFIGLGALEALVPALAERARITINFDPGFERKVGMSQQAIRARLSGARVHFVPRGMSADPFVLNYVEGKPYAYVISNDTFRDYGEKQAVYAKRILGHAILNDRVSIPALGIVARLAVSEAGHNDAASLAWKRPSS